MHNQLTVLVGKVKSISKEKELDHNKKEIFYTVEVERNYENSKEKKDKDIIECVYITDGSSEDIKKGNTIAMKGSLFVDKKQIDNLNFDSLILKVNEFALVSKNIKDRISLSQSLIVGNLAITPVLRETTNGNKVANITVAVNTRFTNKTEFIRTAIWGKLAEKISRYDKGDVVSIEGRLKTINKTLGNKEVLITEYSSESISVLARSKSNKSEKEIEKDLGE